MTIQFFKKSEDILSRSLYEKITVILAIPLYALFLLGIYNGWLPLTESFFPRYLILFSVPILLFSLYITSYKKIFPQRVGDCLQIIIWAAMIAAGNTYWGGPMRMDGPLFPGFVMMTPFFVLLLDSFLPYFIAGFSSFFLIIEFLLRMPELAFLSIMDFLFKIIVLWVLALISTSLINKTLGEQKAKLELKELNESLEQKVEKRTGEIKERKEELERFYQLTVGRELKMIDLKKKIKELEN